jgi:hypothetical protein
MANYELSKFYEKTVLKPDEEALKQLNEEALAAEGTENKKLYVSLGEMYKEAVLRVNETVVNPNLTDAYLNNLDALTKEQKKQLELHPEYKKRLPHKLSLNQKRAIFESMSVEQYAKILRERLDLENGVINPSDGGGPAAISAGPTYDSDATVYFASVASNGGTITTANKTAFNNAFLSLKSTNANDGSSLWSHINQGYFFFGQESYSNGLFVPFYNTNVGSGLQPINTSIATPNGNAFTYTKTGGLVFDGSTNYIDTGINNATTGGVGGTWPVTTTTGPSNNRHGYSYITNTGQSFAGTINFVPFGQGPSVTSRAFQLTLTYNGSSRSGRLYNNSATSGNISSSQLFVDGGWGIPSPNYTGGLGINTVFGANRGASVSVASPATTALVNSNIYIGYGANNFSSGNFLSSTFGCSFNGGAGDFALLDGIITTLKAALI